MPDNVRFVRRGGSSLSAAVAALPVPHSRAAAAAAEVPSPENNAAPPRGRGGYSDRGRGRGNGGHAPSGSHGGYRHHDSHLRGDNHHRGRGRGGHDRPPSRRQRLLGLLGADAPFHNAHRTTPREERAFYSAAAAALVHPMSGCRDVVRAWIALGDLSRRIAASPEVAAACRALVEEQPQLRSMGLSGCHCGSRPCVCFEQEPLNWLEVVETALNKAIGLLPASRALAHARKRVEGAEEYTAQLRMTIKREKASAAKAAKADAAKADEDAPVTPPEPTTMEVRLAEAEARLVAQRQEADDARAAVDATVEGAAFIRLQQCLAAVTAAFPELPQLRAAQVEADRLLGTANAATGGIVEDSVFAQRESPEDMVRRALALTPRDPATGQYRFDRAPVDAAVLNQGGPPSRQEVAQWAAWFRRCQSAELKKAEEAAVDSVLPSLAQSNPALAALCRGAPLDEAGCGEPKEGSMNTFTRTGVSLDFAVRRARFLVFCRHGGPEPRPCWRLLRSVVGRGEQGNSQFCELDGVLYCEARAHVELIFEVKARHADFVLARRQRQKFAARLPEFIRKNQARKEAEAAAVQAAEAAAAEAAAEADCDVDAVPAASSETAAGKATTVGDEKAGEKADEKAAERARRKAGKAALKNSRAAKAKAGGPAADRPAQFLPCDGVLLPFSVFAAVLRDVVLRWVLVCFDTAAPWTVPIIGPVGFILSRQLGIALGKAGLALPAPYVRGSQPQEPETMAQVDRRLAPYVASLEAAVGRTMPAVSDKALHEITQSVYGRQKAAERQGGYEPPRALVTEAADVEFQNVWLVPREARVPE